MTCCCRQQSIQNYVSGELFDQTSEDVSGDILVSYYLTSIYDHSVLEAFSKVGADSDDNVYSDVDDSDDVNESDVDRDDDDDDVDE